MLVKMQMMRRRSLPTVSLVSLLLCAACLWWRSCTISDQINYSGSLGKCSDIDLILTSRDGSLRLSLVKTTYRDAARYVRAAAIVAGLGTLIVCHPIFDDCRRALGRAIANDQCDWNSRQIEPRRRQKCRHEFHLHQTSIQPAHRHFGVFPLLWLIKWERNRKRRSGFPLIVAVRALCHSFSIVKLHPVTVYPSKAKLPRQDQLAWKIAQVAADAVPIEPAVGEMVINRIIDNASVAIAATNRRRRRMRARSAGASRGGGATVFGLASEQRFECEWAAWANGTAGARIGHARHVSRRGLFASG